MSRGLASLVLLVVLIVGAAPVRADSIPIVEGLVSGIELCQQSVCGAAVFFGFYVGQVGTNPRAIGTMSVAVTHDDLPVDDSAAITGGVWRLRLLSGRTLSGVVNGGLLSNPCNGSDNAYCVHVELEVLNGGSGTILFDGVLSHDVFPPTIAGTLSQ